jgi:hypothetical protein
LRYHAYEGSPKWASLLLWAGADPCARGIYRLDDLEQGADDTEEAPNAVELAVMAGKLDVLKVPRMLTACRPPRQAAGRLLEQAYSPEPEMLTFLFEQGHDPSALPDRGTTALNMILHSLTFEFPTTYSSFGETGSRAIDSSRARERMKTLHMLLANGAKWLPSSSDIATVRRSFLKMAPGYLLEFAWLLRAYQAARKRDVLDLFRTSSVTRLLADKRSAAEQIIAGIPEEAAPAVLQASADTP